MNTISFYEFRSEQTGSGARSYIFKENKSYRSQTCFNDMSRIYQNEFFQKKLGFTPCKAEQPLWGMKLQEKKHKKKITGYRKSV